MAMSCNVTVAKRTRSTTAPAMPQKMTLALFSGATRAAARPTTMALSAASVMSIMIT